MTLPPQPAPEQPHRLLAIDAGQRRTGVAISDELGLFAHTRPAIMGADTNAVIAAIARTVTDDAITEVVVGLPLTLSGAESAQTRATRDFVRRLREALTVPVSVWDERLTSREAAHSVKGAARRRSGELDSAAAGLILQAVLDSRRLRAQQ